RRPPLPDTTLFRSLDEILRQGRSLGVIVVSATQEVTKEIVSARNSYGWRIALRLERAEEVEMLLGKGAVEQGARPHEIAPATPSNGYVTAGIGWVRSDTPACQGELSPPVHSKSAFAGRDQEQPR